MLKAEIKSINHLKYELGKFKDKWAEIIELLAQGKHFELKFIEIDLKTRDQEKRYHAMLGDIARQSKHLDEVLEMDDWKRLCVAQFRADCIESGDEKLQKYWAKQRFKLMPSLDGKSLVQLGAQTRKFPRNVASAFIEWLYKYGSENDIQWSDPKEQWYRERAA